MKFANKIKLLSFIAPSIIILAVFIYGLLVYFQSKEKTAQTQFSNLNLPLNYDSLVNQCAGYLDLPQYNEAGERILPPDVICYLNKDKELVRMSWGEQLQITPNNPIILSVDLKKAKKLSDIKKMLDQKGNIVDKSFDPQKERRYCLGIYPVLNDNQWKIYPADLVDNQLIFKDNHHIFLCTRPIKYSEISTISILYLLPQSAKGLLGWKFYLPPEDFDKKAEEKAIDESYFNNHYNDFLTFYFRFKKIF